MRRLGVLSRKVTADHFERLLKSKRLEARRDETAAGTEFWLYDEDRLGELRDELQRYERGDYVPVPEVEIPQERAAPRDVETAPRRPNRLWQLISPAPWTIGICLACITATLLTGFFQANNQFSRALGIIPMNLQPGGRATFSPLDDDPLLWLSRGQVWRLFTPALIHGSALHLLLNLNLFYVFGTAIEHLRGTARLAGLTLLSAAAGNIVQYWWGGPLFCGLSGVGYGLYGYVWMKALFQPETRFVIPRSLHVTFWIWTLICFSGLLPIANGAHAAGLAVGILYGLIRVL